MSILSKSEVLFLQGQKQVSKTYEYKLKSTIRKKVANLMAKEVPLPSSLFPKLDLAGVGKERSLLKATISGLIPPRFALLLVFKMHLLTGLPAKEIDVSLGEVSGGHRPPHGNSDNLTVFVISFV
jgi:hypothetical protein